jgi:hypothetical protein
VASSPDYASSIATATDLAGHSWAAWADNGLIYAARWDSAANRWGDAAVISNATGGRNLHLTVGQLLRDSKTGQDQPTLVVTWESGIDNDADVLAAVGIYRNDGTVLWSDAVNLLPGGVAESNHSIGISGNRLVLATEAQAVVAPLASGPADGQAGQYQDSDINTYSLALQSRASTLGSGDPSYLQPISGSQWSGRLSNLVSAPGLSGVELISAAVNGTPLSLGATTTINGLGSFTLSKAGELSFNRGSNPLSELLFTAELIGQGAGGLRSYARSSALLRPSELVSQATTANGNEGYTISVSTLNGAGNVIGTSTVPLSFNASERLERVSATTFAPQRARADGSSLRDFTGSGRFSDGSLERAISAAEGQTNLERSSLLSQAQPSSAGEWFEQTFANPYVLYRGQINRFGISLSDLLNSLSGSSVTSIPLLSSLTSKTGFNIGFDGLINYLSSGEIGSQTLTATAVLNFSLGRSVDSRDYAAIREARARNANPISPNPSSLTNRASQQTTNKKQVRFTEEAIQNGKTLNDRASVYVTANSSTLRRLQGPNEVRKLIEDNRKRYKKGGAGNNLFYNDSKDVANSFTNTFGTKDKEALRKFLQQPASPNTAATVPFSIQYGYLFGVVPLRALELNFASRELYSYSTSAADGLRDPNLIAKRLQFGVGVNVGIAGAVNFGLGARVSNNTIDPNEEFYLTPDKSRTGKYFSLLDVQGEAGLKANYSFGLGFDTPKRPLEGSLIWKDKNYERAYLPAFERASTGLQKLYLNAFYLAQGLIAVAPVAANVKAVRTAKPSITAASDLGKTGLGRLAGGLSILNLGAQAVSQFPFIFTATDLIFSNLGPSAFANRGKDFSLTYTVNGYANGSISFLNGLLSGYTRNSAGLIWSIYPPGLGYQYSTEVGFSVGGISKSLVNLSGSGTLAGNTSGFIANTFLEGAPALSASFYSIPASSEAPLSQPLSTPPLQISASGGSLNLAALAGAGTPLTSALATGDLALSIYAVVVAPTEGAVDADGNLVDFRLSFSGSPLPLRVALDSRALLSSQARLSLAEPWQMLVNQWADSSAGTSTGALAGIKPGSAIPLLLELRLPRGSDPASLVPLQLAYSLDGRNASFGSASAPLLAAMPASPLRRKESGSAFELGTTASGTIGAATSSSDPYIAGFVVAAAGSGYSDTDFILEESGAVVRGRLNTTVNGGAVSSADLFQTASSTAFAGTAYNRLGDAALKARLSSGSDAQVVLSAKEGRLDGARLVLAVDGKTPLAGSGYLGGGSGVFSQWVSGIAANPGDRARALLRLVVKDGRIAEVGLLRQEGSFSASQASAIGLANSVAGAGSGLALVPLIRTTVDTNLLDESGLSLGGFQRYVDGAFRSEADLVYTQGGPDRSRAISSSLNLDTPLIVNRLAGDGRGWSNLAFIDPPDTITPGVDGFNFDSSSESLYFNNDVIGGKRSVVLFSHADLSAIRNDKDLYLLEEALLQAQVYTALERKDARNNLFFDKPVLLSDPNQEGTNSNGTILPFYAVQGAGVAPIADANNQLLAAWVHTSASGQAEIQVRIGSASGKADAGSNDSSRINWGPIRSIALPANVGGNDVTELGLTYLDGRTPVLSWSLNSLTPYQAGVLRGNPTAYYRLNDLPSEGSLANIAGNQEAEGQLAGVGEISRFSSWLDSADSPLTKAPVRSGTGALLPDDPASPQPGDADPALRFEGGAFGEVPNVFLNRLSGLSNEQPSGYSADFWVNSSAAEGSGSLLDNGLYNPNALLPGSEQLKMPVLLRRIASTETIDGVETRGYRYSLVVAAGTFADLGSDGLGSGLSPFNLRFAAPEANLSFSSASAGISSFAFQGADLNDFAQYRTQGGKLSSFTLGDQEVELGSSFVADANSPGTTKTPEVITYDSLKLGLQTAQIPGWSLRKRVVGERQFVDFNYGIDKANGAAATLTAELPSGVWSHVAISYGEEQGSSSKVARLFINGQLAGEAVENPENLKGYDFNLLPYQLGYNLKGSLDELVLSDAPITNPADQLGGRLATRFVDPKSATQATQFSPGVFDAKTGSWSWQPAAPFIKADYIPSTIPGASRPGPVDMATAGSTAELRGDGKADLHARLSLSGIAVGSLITGIRARVTAADGSIKELAVGDGLSYGLDGKVSTTPISALIGVVANGTGLNSGDGGRQLNMAVMGGSTDLDLYLPVDPSLSGKPVELVAIVRSPQNRVEGGNRFTVWPFASGTALPGTPQPTFRATLEASNGATVLSPYYASQKLMAPVQRPETTSLLDVNSGFVSSLAQTNEPTLASPNEQVYAEALAAGSLKLSSGATAFLAIANPSLDGIAGSGKARGVVWVLRNDSNEQTKGTAERLQTLQSLVGTPESRLAATSLEGLVIVGRDGQQLGGSLIWADLDGDGNDELVLSCPRSESSSGVAASGCLVILSGAFLAGRAASGSRRIDLNDASLYNDSTKLRLFAGPEGSEFGTALAYGKVTANGNALLIGAPGYRTEVSTDFRGDTIATGSRQRQSVGAVYQLNADRQLFSGSTATPFQLISGDLPGLANFNSGVDPIARRFGSSISLTSATSNRDFNNDNIADIAIGIPGLVQSRVLKGGINQRATVAQREADLAQRSNIPDVYREGIDATSLSDPRDVTMGGVLLLSGGATNADQAGNAKKVLLLGDTVFGDAAGAGAALASGGDFNNDNIDDLAVGMPEVDAKTGAVSMISGATIRSWFQQATATNYGDIKTLQRSTLVDASLIIQNEQANGLYGRSLALNGDVNADGIADLVIGDPNFAENSGRVNVLFGSSKFGGDVKGQSVAKGPSGDTIYHRLDITNPATRLDIYPGSFGEGLGRSVLLAPTGKAINGTPSADLLLPSSNGSSTLLTLYGKTRLKGLGSFSSRDLGSSEGVEIDGLTRRPGTPPRYGLLGDVNGDGNADALVDLDPNPGQARFRLSFGSGAGFSPDQQDSGTGGSSTLNLTGILGVQNPGASGFSLRDVRAIGDLNSDGSDDLLIRYGYTRENRSFERNAVLQGGDLLTSNVLLQTAVLRPLAAPKLTGDTLLAGQTLRPGEYLLSPNGHYMAVMQTDGNFVVQTLSNDGRTWDVSFALSDVYTKFNQSINIAVRSGEPRVGSTPGTQLELRGGKLTFVSESFKAAYGFDGIALQPEYLYARNNTYYAINVNPLPAGTTFQELRLGDDGVLVGKASDGTILFSFDRYEFNDSFNAPIPADKLSDLTLKLPIDQAMISPIGTAITAANGEAPTLLGLAQGVGITQLRWVSAQDRAVDVAALYEAWLAGFPRAATQAEQEQLDSFNTSLKQQLQSFDPKAADAAQVSADNLELVSGTLEAIVAGAGASFRNFVEGRSTIYGQQAVTLLQSHGDAPSGALLDGDLPVQTGDVLLPGQRLRAGDYLLSPNGLFMAVMQADGNFVVQTRRSDIDAWDVSFSLNDYKNDQNNQIPFIQGTSLELRNGKLTFVNEGFGTADGSNAIAVTTGSYRRGNANRQVTVKDLAAGTSLSELRLGNDGVLRATASDGSTVFSFERYYDAKIISTPIPADKLQGYGRKITGYDGLDLNGRDTSLVDRNGDGVQELLVGPSASDPSWYSIDLSGVGARSANSWFATPINQPSASSGSFLWESNGSKPSNTLNVDQSGTTAIRKINGYSRRASRVDPYLLGQPVETGGDLGVNGASLSRQMLYLGDLHQSNTYGQYSRRIGGAELSQHLSQNGESFELKLPATVWQMNTKGDGEPANEGADELVLHIGSGSGIKDRVGDTNSSSIGLDGLAMSFNEYKQTFSLFWNGQRIFQAGPNSTANDLARLLSSDGKTKIGLDELKNFMAPDGGLHNRAGLDTGPELMSWFGNWISNLMTSASYIRWQRGPFLQDGKTYQGKLIIEIANAARYLPFESGFQATFRLNSLNKALQICIPLEQAIQLNSSEVNFNTYAWSGANPGLHALGGVEFNTDKPLEGSNLKRLIAAGDLNGDGYGDMVGLGSLASGWNYDYKLDLPNNNLKQRGSNSSSQAENSFTLNNGADGTAITRTTLISPVIVWGGPGDINLDDLTPIVRGTPINSGRYLPKGTPESSTDPGLAFLDNFTAADNVLYTALGDVNGDAFDDLGIADSGSGGSAYILYGGTGLQSAQSYLERFGTFLPETRAKDSTILPIQVAESPDVYLTSNPKGFGRDADGTSTAWINAINLERSAAPSNSGDPAFGAVRVTKITGVPGQQLADLSGGGDFSGDGLADLFLTSQEPFNSLVDPSQQPPSRYVMFGGDDTRSITLLGTPDSDSLKGTPVNDVIISLAGNDIVQGKGGMDAINAGPGDDQVYVDDDQFRRLDGGSGEDTLILQGQRNQNWDFSKLASAGRIRGFESIDSKDYGANLITLNAAAARAMSDKGELFINGDLRSETAANLLTAALSQQIDGLPEGAPLRQPLREIGSRFASFSFGQSDLSMVSVVSRDVQLDLVFDQLRRFNGEPSQRPLDDLLGRLDAIDAATPLQPGQSSAGVELGFAFLQPFSQNLAFTPVSALVAYQAWLEALPELEPERYSLLSAQQRNDLAALPGLWRSAYPSYFNANGQAPAALAFERSLSGSGTIAEAYRQWLSSVGVGTYRLPASSDAGQKALLDQLSDLANTAQELLNQVLASGDALRLSTEFALINSDVQLDSRAFSEYAASGGSVSVLVPEWMAVLIDPSVPTTLIPTPATQSSRNPNAMPGTSLESEQATLRAPVVTAAAPGSRDNLRINVSESSRSDDGRSLIFTLSRSGYLAETSRVAFNTLGYVADLVPSVQGQVVFAPGVTSQEVRIPLMASLPGEEASLDPYDNPLSSDISLELTLLPAGSVGPRSTSVLALNALNAFTPELDNPSRPLPANLVDPAKLFSRHIALQLPTALWFTAEAINSDPIRFGLDNPQGQPLNDIQLLDRVSGSLVSLFQAADAGEAVIYGDNYLSPSSDLYFSVNDGGRFDQDGLADNQITLAAAGAITSPGSLLIAGNVLRAPSARSMNLVLNPPSGGFSGTLAAYGDLLLIPTDDINGGLHQGDGSVLQRSDGDAYLNALAASTASDSPFAAALRRIPLNGAAAPQALNLLNDTNYVAVLSSAQPGEPASASNLRLVNLRSLGERDSRAVASYALELDGQRLAFTLTSPYLVVPGVQGSTLALTSLLRAPSGRQGQPLQVAWLRVDDVDGNLQELLNGDDLATRLITIPADGVVELQGGDILLPVLFRGIDPQTWAALPPQQRRLGASSQEWSVDLPEPALNPTSLLQRSDASSYRIGIDGLLQLRFGKELQATLAAAVRVLGTPLDDAFLATDPALGLNFRGNLVLSGDGADRVDSAATADAGDNLILLGSGDDELNAGRNDVAFAGEGSDRLRLEQGVGNRIDAGSDDDTFLVGSGGQRLVGGTGNDSVQFTQRLSSAVVAAGGRGGDRFWLTTTNGEALGAVLVISDFAEQEGDRLILPGSSFSDLSFSQLGSDVQISKGNTTLALLLNRSLEQISTPEIFRFDPLSPDTSLSKAIGDPSREPVYGDGLLQSSEIISDGINGLAAFARRALGSGPARLSVYLHTAAGNVAIGGGKSGAQSIDTIAIANDDAEWMRDQIRLIASSLDVELRFVADKAESNLDIYVDSAISLAPDRSTLGITLANDNGKQAWWEVLLNGSLLSGDANGFRYAFLHELGHVFGLEHPFDNSDGDAEGQRFGSPDADTTIMSYSRPSGGWPSGFQPLDWEALVSLWGLNSRNTSGWLFRDATGAEVVLNSAEALARLQSRSSGDQFLGRADGLRIDAPSPASQGDGSTPQPTTTENSPTGSGVSIDKTADPGAGDIPVVRDLPLIVDRAPAITTLTPGRLDWQPNWRQLDLELGVAVDASNTLQLLSPALYGLTPREHQQLVDLELNGSSDADVVFASSGSRIDLGLGQDTLISLVAGGGGNRLYGGRQSDLFLLAAAGDIAYGGTSLDGSHDSVSDGAANQFLIDLSARPSGYRSDPAASIEIRDFQPGLDAITLITGDPQQARPLPINAANYLEWRNRLEQEQNILLNATPQIRMARRGLLISEAMLAEGFRLEAGDFFSDPDLPADQSLQLVGYDNSLPWLQSVDGALVVAPGSTVADGSYRLSLAGSDGLSRTPFTALTLAVNPTVSIGSLTLEAGARLDFRFPSIGGAAVSLLVQTLDTDGLPLGSPVVVAGQVGNSSGTPVGFDPFRADGVAGDLLQAGRLAFFLRRLDQPDALMPLQIRNDSGMGFSLQAADGSTVQASVRNADETDAVQPLFAETRIEAASFLGLDLPDAAGQAKGSSREVSLSMTMYREAAYDSRVSFYLADRKSGAVIDSVTGAMLSGAAFDEMGKPFNDYLSTAAAHTVIDGLVDNGQSSTISRSFQLSSALDPNSLILLPLLTVDDPSGQKIYGATPTLNPDRISHVAQIGINVFGFEDIAGGGDLDYDDILVKIMDVSYL